MATTIYSALNLQRIPPQGLRLENLATAPTGGNAGDLYFDTTLGHARVCLGADVWVKAAVTGIVDADIAPTAAIALSKLATDPLARTNHTGTQTAATVSDFDTQVRTSRLDQMGAPTGDVAMGAHKLTGLADPTAAQDAATRLWVTSLLDTRVTGQDWKASVRVRSASQVDVTDAPALIDGVTMAAGERVLLAGQTLPEQNGLYVWTAPAAVLARAGDADTSAEVTAGLTVAVAEGTSADTVWLLTSNDVIDLGTTPLTFTQIGAAGATYTAGTGLALTGNAFSLSAPVAIALGGTGATTAAAARASLGITQAGFAANIGAMSAGTGVALAHGLGTPDVVVMVRDAASGAMVALDVVVDATNVTLTSAVAVSGLRVVVVPAA